MEENERKEILSIIDTLLIQGRYPMAVKAYQTLYNCSLTEAKIAVDKIKNGENIDLLALRPDPTSPDYSSDNVIDYVRTFTYKIIPDSSKKTGNPIVKFLWILLLIDFIAIIIVPILFHDILSDWLICLPIIIFIVLIFLIWFISKRAMKEYL